MKPGDTVPWHYHKGVSYVILSRGTLTEQHLVGPNQCESEELSAGGAFVEPAGLVHSVTNTGNGSAEIWWATIPPKRWDRSVQPLVPIRRRLSCNAAAVQVRVPLRWLVPRLAAQAEGTPKKIDGRRKSGKIHHAG